MIAISRSSRALARAALLTAAIVALSAVTSSAASAQAGGQGGPARGAAAQQAMMFEGITLTAAQTAQVDSIRGAFREKMMSLPRPAQGERPDSASMATRRQLNDDQRVAVRGVLTAEQAKTFDANVEKMRSAPRGAGRPNGDR